MHADTVYALAAVRSRDLTAAAIRSRWAVRPQRGRPFLTGTVAQVRDRWSTLRPAPSPVACCA